MLISLTRLKSFIIRASMKTGVSIEDAVILADVLVTTDLRGVRTHGCVRFPIYVKNLYYEKYNPKPNICIERRTPTTLAVDGNNGLGPVIMVRALEATMNIAAEYGTAAAGIRNCNHIGACGYYGSIAAKNGYIAVVTTEAVPMMAPYGAADRYFGTNPICIALPHQNGFPVVADMATSVAAYGKINAARHRGARIPLGWALDKDGNPTTDASEAVKGVLLPFGAHKGSALAFAASYMSGVMTGASFGYDLTPSSNLSREKNCDVGAFISLVKCDAFIDREQVETRMDKVCADIKALRPVSGVQEVMLPGETEYRTLEHGLDRDGLEIDDKLVGELEEVGRLLEIDGLYYLWRKG